ncbi:SprT-like domain-containing protein [Jiulongibacter sediminis]|uniref:SprT-like domain-containing protein n=1 Tax=Jiulongibacter sediminis TaxID=1605367 RepID=A0A0P7C362_9BACT|nr:SprT-like domain-containing protein [Jiulongibacter sediminis]KPM49064.1 hypothetical protein AFM12_09750 [Jiulongibacter sediminis]TBX25580.1 hypothetical protein TK44_09755 [Jiulongibacter sediminis]
MKLTEVLKTQVPENALEYCVNLWQEHPFSFKITRSRNSCLGNYRFQNGHHTITVNHDLNVYNFLVTYIHEVAHQRVFIFDRKKKTLPHGEEWKSRFRELMLPLLNEKVFPPEILMPLSLHMRNPKASSTRDAQLMRAFRAFDENRKAAAIHLEDIELGQSFVFKKRIFKKLEAKRTRAVCMEIASKRKYTIPLLAEITPVDR